MKLLFSHPNYRLCSVTIIVPAQLCYLLLLQRPWSAMSTKSHHSSSSTCSASSTSHLLSPTPYPTVSSSSIKYSLSTSTRSSGGTNGSPPVPFQYKTANPAPPFYLNYVQDSKPYPSSDLSAQDFDFDFEDLFTFTNRSHSTISTHPTSSASQQTSTNHYTKHSNSTALFSQRSASELPPQAQGRSRSKFSFSYYTNTPTPRSSTGTRAAPLAGQTTGSRLQR